MCNTVDDKQTEGVHSFGTETIALLGRVVIVVALGVTLSTGLAGCSRHARCDCAYGTPSPVDVERIPERGVIHVNASEVVGYDELEHSLPERLPAADYRRLTPIECQCLAIRNAPMANLLDTENDINHRRGHNFRGKPSAADVQSELLRLRTMEMHNQVAGDALEAFYQLTEAEGKRDLLAKSLAEIDKAIDHQRQLLGRGIKLSIDKGIFSRQRLDLIRNSHKLETTIDQLNGKLRFLLHLDPHDLTPIWPDVELTPRAEAIDVDAAIGEGLALRADLAALRLMSETLDADTLPIVRKGLQRIDLSLGGERVGRLRIFSLILNRGRRDETQRRGEQLAQLEYDRRRAAVEEIRQAAYEIDYQIRAVSLSAEKVVSLKARRADLMQLREADGVTPFDIINMTLEILQADSDLLQNVTNWKIAQVKLKKAQGRLAYDCN